MGFLLQGHNLPENTPKDKTPIPQLEYNSTLQIQILLIRLLLLILRKSRYDQ